LIGVLFAIEDSKMAFLIGIGVVLCLIFALISILRTSIVLTSEKIDEEEFIPSEDSLVPVIPEDDFIDPSVPNGEDIKKPTLAIKEGRRSYFENYVKYIDEKNGENATQRVKTDIEVLLGEDNDIKKGRINEIISMESKNRRVNGLVVGRVQAGKTQNFTGLITKAMDQKWNVVIVLTSPNVALANQTKSRLKNDLEKSGLDESSYVFIDDFVKKKNLMPTIDSNKIYVGVAIKQIDHLQGRENEGGRDEKGLCGFFAKNKDVLTQVSVLIIDDEADNCSLNSNQGQSEWNASDIEEYINGLAKNDEPIVSTWVKDICLNLEYDEDDKEWMELRKECRRVSCTQNDAARIVTKYRELLRLDRGYGDNQIDLYTYILNYFTSPFRSPEERKNLKKVISFICGYQRERSRINDAVCYIVGRSYMKSVSFDFKRLAYVGYTATPYGVLLNERRDGTNPLQLDFIQSMEVAPEYFGLSKIFGDNSNGDPTQPRMPIMKEVTLGNEFNVNDLKEPIAWAFITAAIRKSRRLAAGDTSRKSRWTTMLVNISRNVKDHREVAKKIEEYIRADVVRQDKTHEYIKYCHCYPIAKDF
jgi:hypothetical protein